MQDDQSLPSRLYHRYLAFVFAFTYRSEHRTFLGIRVSSWCKWLAVAPFLFALWQGWGIGLSVVAAMPYVWVRLIYWRARLKGYIRFIPAPANGAPSASPPSLAADEHVPGWATGAFQIEGSQEYGLLRPAEYWRVPLGAHVIMVRMADQRFRYRILERDSIRRVQLGELLFGRRLQNSIAVAFVQSEDAEISVQFSFGRPPSHKRTPEHEFSLYLTFEDQQSQLAVWQSMVQDSQRQTA